MNSTASKSESQVLDLGFGPSEEHLCATCNLPAVCVWLEANVHTRICIETAGLHTKLGLGVAGNLFNNMSLITSVSITHHIVASPLSK